MKKVWLTSLSSSNETVTKLISHLKTYGLEANGHFWEDNLEELAWIKARDRLIDSSIIFWAILASDENLNTPTIRYGLSLLTIAVQAQRELSFPIFIIQTEGEDLSPDTLTTVLKGVDVLSASDTSLGAKLVAKTHAPPKEISPEYRLNIHGNAHIGQWFEVGPYNLPWSGAIFGVNCGEITFHAVGPKGSLPKDSVLNYPMKGMRLILDEKEYVAWSVQNEVDFQTSYFVKVKGFPKSVIFGSYSTEKEAELSFIELQ
ncbi:MAG: hypothetical protein SVY10_15545 [Thermodesulfobacteriota bacterium]|nr:hypothetical protein [Thermodesulfobacteriota bacterium]